MDILDIQKYSKHLRQKINISKYEESIKDPGIIHNVLCSPKPWHFNSKFIKKNTACEKRKDCNCDKFHNLWHFYAKKTNYYHEIINFLNKKKKKYLK